VCFIEPLQLLESKVFLERNRITFNTTAAKYSTLVMELDIARHAGYTAVEISQDKARIYLDAGYSVDDLRSELDGLVVHGIGALVDIERQGSAEKELFREADKLFTLAYAIGAKGVHIVSGPLDVQAVTDFNEKGYSKLYTGLLHHRHDDQVKLTDLPPDDYVRRVFGQYLRSHVAIARGMDIEGHRNRAKSVTLKGDLSFCPSSIFERGGCPQV
jgi:hypothetical protein